jgi:hypothetical protein
MVVKKLSFLLNAVKTANWGQQGALKAKEFNRSSRLGGINCSKRLRFGVRLQKIMGN